MFIAVMFENYVVNSASEWCPIGWWS